MNYAWTLLEGDALTEELKRQNVTIGEWASIGEWAIIGNGASIGKGASIGERANIGEWASIGKGARIGKGASIGKWAIIGKGARIGEWASIGERASIENTLDCIVMGPLGTDNRMLTFYRSKTDTMRVATGCFDGTPTEFLVAVENKHGDSRLGKEYRIALEYGKAKAALWT